MAVCWFLKSAFENDFLASKIFFINFDFTNGCENDFQDDKE